MLSRFLRPARHLPSLLRSLSSLPPPPLPLADASSPLPPPLPPLSAPSSPSSPSPDGPLWLRHYPLFPPGAKPGEVSVLWGIDTPNTWLTEAVAKQIHPQIISSLNDLGIQGRIVLFSAFGDTAQLSTEVRVAIQWEGIKMIVIPDWETELLGAMKMMEESPDQFQPGSYVVLICSSGGSRLVRQAEVLKGKGYHVIVVVPPGETICEDLRLAVEHCINLQ